MSTVASGAATMKMISRISITSMNGVTLISWLSTRSSSFWELELRLPAMVLLRSLGQLFPHGAGMTVVDIAADQPFDSRCSVTQEEPVTRDRTGEDVIDDDGRNSGNKADSRGKQSLGNTGRDDRKVRGLRFRNADERVHDAPDGAKQAHEGSCGTD